MAKENDPRFSEAPRTLDLAISKKRTPAWAVSGPRRSCFRPWPDVAEFVREESGETVGDRPELPAPGGQ